jgi:cell division protein FtsI/penicillin-binding protein 2
VLAGSALLAGCTGTNGPTAQDAAQKLAVALTKGSLSGERFTAGTTPQQAQQAWHDATASLGSTRPTVRVQGVSGGDDGKPATATLAWTWTLLGSTQPWTYRSKAGLARAGDTWRVAWRPSLVHPQLRTGEHLDSSTVAAVRGDILGAGGAEIVKPRPVYRLGIDKAQVPAAQAVGSARALARRVDVDVASYADLVRSAGPKAFVQAIVLRPADARPLLSAGIADIKGVGVLTGKLPLAPTREFARPILGSVGPVTAEIVKQSHGSYRAGDQAGLSGLESRYDQQLRGRPGLVVDAVDAHGTKRQLFATDPVEGKPLRTTLDVGLQSAAERALSGVRPASALVAIRPSTGDILAAASGPGSAGLNTATEGRFAPGSTFKVVSSLALLRAGLTPSSILTCPARTVVDGKSFKNYSDYPTGGTGRIPLRTAVANSCNTAFVTARGKVQQSDLAKAAASLGIGVDHDLGFPAFFGSVPSQAASETEHAASLIGQGKVVASPMAMATVAASVAHGGTVVPRLLPDAKVADAGSAPADPPTPREAAELRQLMRAVVVSGSGSFLRSLPGAPVLAKTGTAEFGDAVPPRTHAWMIAVHGDLAVAVFVDVGESGSQTAGPVLEQFLRAAG